MGMIFTQYFTNPFHAIQAQLHKSNKSHAFIALFCAALAISSATLQHIQSSLIICLIIVLALTLALVSAIIDWTAQLLGLKPNGKQLFYGLCLSTSLFMFQLPLQQLSAAIPSSAIIELLQGCYVLAILAIQLFTIKHVYQAGIMKSILLWTLPGLILIGLCFMPFLLLALLIP